MNRTASPLAGLKKISENPKYAACEAELGNLMSALARIGTALEDMDQQLRTFSAGTPQDAVNDALHFSATGELRQPNLISSLQEQHIALRRQRDAVDAAIRAKRHEQVQLVSELSAEQCRALDGVHRKLAGRYLKTLKEMDALYREEEAMFDAINSAGYRVQFRHPIAWPLVGTLQHRNQSALSSHYCDLEMYAVTE